MEELGGQGERQDVAVGLAAAGLIGVVDERRTEALPPLDGELADAVDQLQGLGGAGGHRLAALGLQPVGEGAVELLAEAGEQRLEFRELRRSRSR